MWQRFLIGAFLWAFIDGDAYAKDGIQLVGPANVRCWAPVPDLSERQDEVIVNRLVPMLLGRSGSVQSSEIVRTALGFTPEDLARTTYPRASVHCPFAFVIEESRAGWSRREEFRIVYVINWQTNYLGDYDLRFERNFFFTNQLEIAYRSWVPVDLQVQSPQSAYRRRMVRAISEAAARITTLREALDFINDRSLKKLSFLMQREVQYGELMGFVPARLIDGLGNVELLELFMGELFYVERSRALELYPELYTRPNETIGHHVGRTLVSRGEDMTEVFPGIRVPLFLDILVRGRVSRSSDSRSDMKNAIIDIFQSTRNPNPEFSSFMPSLSRDQMIASFESVHLGWIHFAQYIIALNDALGSDALFTSDEITRVILNPLAREFTDRYQSILGEPRPLPVRKWLDINYVDGTSSRINVERYEVPDRLYRTLFEVQAMSDLLNFAESRSIYSPGNGSEAIEGLRGFLSYYAEAQNADARCRAAMRRSQESGVQRPRGRRR